MIPCFPICHFPSDPPVFRQAGRGGGQGLCNDRVGDSGYGWRRRLTPPLPRCRPLCAPKMRLMLDSARLTGYISSGSGDQAARDRTRLCGGDLDSTGVERRWLRVEVP